MITDPFSPERGPLHDLDARVKLVTVFICLMAVSALQNSGTALAALCFTLVMIPAAGLNVSRVLRRLVPANLFFLGLGLVLMLTYPDRSPAGISWISIDGSMLALHIALKGNAMLLIILILVFTTSIPALSQALQALGVPARLTLLLAFTHRQIFLVADEFQRLQRAAVARGFQPGCNLHTCKTWAVIFGQTLLRSVDRAERIRSAMLLRGFSGRFHTLAPPPPVWSKTLSRTCFCLPLPILCLYDRWPL